VGDRLKQQGLGGATDTLARANQHGERGLWQFGATADWVYRSPQTIGRVGGDPLAAKVKNWSSFETVRPGSSPTPALIVGEVTPGAPPAGSTMVVAVNGRIGGTAGFYPPRPGGRPITFAAMVPDFLFNPGPGQPQIQAYLATRSAGAVTLRPVRLSG
jgi:hypothetical protein